MKRLKVSSSYLSSRLSEERRLISSSQIHVAVRPPSKHGLPHHESIEDSGSHSRGNGLRNLLLAQVWSDHGGVFVPRPVGHFRSDIDRGALVQNRGKAHVSVDGELENSSSLSSSIDSHCGVIVKSAVEREVHVEVDRLSSSQHARIHFEISCLGSEGYEIN